MDMTEMKISEAAKTALLAALSNRQGERVSGTPTVLGELSLAGLIGRCDGLTRKGTIVRERLMMAMIEGAFA